MTCAEILRQFHVCQILLEQSTNQMDLARLTTCSKAFADARKLLLYDTFTLTLRDQNSFYEFAIAKGARRLRVFGDWIYNHEFDFTKREKRLLKFVCWRFNQPIASFGALMHFECNNFNQAINLFDSLKDFRCQRFNQPIMTRSHILNAAISIIQSSRLIP